MKAKPRAASRGRRWMLGSAALLLAAVLATALYCGYLAIHIKARFDGRRWRIPSQVYSDTTLLYPGQRINRRLLRDKLSGLGYRRVDHRPRRSGEFQQVGGQWRLFLRELKTPAEHRAAMRADLHLRGNRVVSITDAAGRALPLLELEPERVMLFFGPRREQRLLVSIDQLPDHLVKAVLAIEDSRFYTHHGVDPRGLARALLANLRHGAVRQGGSTITQQLAKNYFLTPERTLGRKFREMLIALTMERLYDKNEILEIYLNEIYFGRNGSVSVNGVGEAARYYFGKPAAKLSLDESATLAGMIRAPNIYSPYLHPDRARRRRNVVLRAMVRKGWLSPDRARRAASRPMHTAGSKRYHRKAPYFMDYLAGQLADLYSPEALSSLGLSIYTTLDTQVQAAAEEALSRGLARLEQRHPRLKGKGLQGAVIVMQPRTGSVLAMVGGRDYRRSQFNRATRALRQPGSTFKPFVYAAALDRFTPASVFANTPTAYTVEGKTWRPRNFHAHGPPRLRMREALARSANLATVDMAVKTGLEHVVETVRKFGFSTPLKPYPSLALGAFEVIPLELARAYSAFAADGRLAFPLSVKEIVDERGKVLKQRYMTVETVISAAKAYLMTSMLGSVVAEGTARGLRSVGFDFPVAAKTGTTNGYRDAWFVGYTPDILILVWVGRDDGGSIGATGAQAAMPIWADIARAIGHQMPGNGFRRPPGVVTRVICSQSGQLAVPGRCPRPMEEVFLENRVPTQYCTLHGGPPPAGGPGNKRRGSGFITPEMK